MDKTFVSDLEFENQEWACLIRSSDVDAKIIDIEIPDLPEGFLFFLQRILWEKIQSVF